MTGPSRLAEVRALFESARRMAPGDQATWLAEQGADPDLRAEVLSLLKHDREAEDEFMAPADDRADATQPRAPDYIGRYRVTGVLGQGASGIVYRGEQTSPQRDVAIKVLRSNLMQAAQVRRFEVEATILARLRHPGIVQVVEAGLHEGQPFFTMELVEGRGLAEASRDDSWPRRARVEIVASLCDIVQHAHQHGIIHRDLKPANIIIDADGRARVLDFGVARVTDSDLHSTTIETRPGSVIGTLAYMSPEQACGHRDEIDTRSDVYALGAILYELLAGQLPHDLDDCMLHEAVQVIRDESPARLSRLDRSLAGGLDAIVQRAMAKSPDRRYPTAAAMGDDLRRFLRGEPIEARPPGPTEQLLHFAGRYRLLAGSVAAVFLVLLAGVISTSIALFEVRRQRDEIRSLYETTQLYSRYSGSLQMMLAQLVERAGADLGTAEVESLVADVRRRIDAELHNDPRLLASAIEGMATRLYWELDSPELGIMLAQEAMNVRREATRTEGASISLNEILRSYNLLGDMLVASSRGEEAMALAEEGMQMASDLPPGHEDSIRMLVNLGEALHTSGRSEAAEPILSDAIAICDMHLDPSHPDIPEALVSRALVRRSLGRAADAEADLRRAIAMHHRYQGEANPATIAAENHLSALLAARPDLE